MGNKRRIKLELSHKLIIIGVVVFIIVLADPLSIRNMILNKNHMYITELKGTSMYPTLEDGDMGVVLLKTAPNYDLQPGDVVVYYNDICNCFIGHRVLAIGQEYIFAKGDNNDVVDPPIEYDYVIGELVDNVPEYNFIKRWLVEMILSPENIPDNS